MIGEVGGDCPGVWAKEVGAVNYDGFFRGDGRFDFGFSFFNLCVAAVLGQIDGTWDVPEAVKKSGPSVVEQHSVGFVGRKKLGERN